MTSSPRVAILYFLPDVLHFRTLLGASRVQHARRVWVDYIRSRSNDANHDIVEFTQQDAIAIIELTEMSLRIIYEFPKKVPAKSKP